MKKFILLMVILFGIVTAMPYVAGLAEGIAAAALIPTE